jgi:rubrerythrin
VGKEPLVIDFIHESPIDWSGGVKDWEHTDEGKKPVINKMYTSRKEKYSFLTSASSTEVYPHPLQDKNIQRVSGVGRADVIVLIPTPDLPHYSDRDYENSFYSQHMESANSERVEALLDEIDQLEEEKAQLQKKLEDAQSDDEDSSSSSGPSKFKCDYCGTESPKSAYKDEDRNGKDFCPSCGNGKLDDAKQVNN